VFGVAGTAQGIAALEAWFDRIGTPTRLSQLGIGAADLPATVDNVRVNARFFGLDALYTREVVTQILTAAL
jgi:alcohol dehydrogenase YqhD (iron-dependent ADH family)